MALGNNPTPNELVKAVKDVEQDKEYLPLLNKTEYKAFAFIDQFVTTSIDYFLPTEISMFDCSKLNDASLEVGDKILVFAKLYTTNADISDYNYVKTRIYLSTITGIYPIVQMFDVQSVLFNINNTSGRNLYRTMAFRDEIPTYTFDTTPTQNSQNPVTSGGIYNAIKREFIEAYTQAEIKLTANTWRNVGGMANLTVFNSSGSKLTMDAETRRIIIGSGVSKVKVYIKARFYCNVTNTRFMVALYKNGVDLNDNISYSSADCKMQYVQFQTDFTSIINVQENDELSFSVFSSNSNSSNQDALQTNTVIIVEVIE